MSATGFLDACGFFPAAGGTADFVVSSAVTGYQTPASAGAANGAVYSYRAQSSDLSQWEIGFGAYATGTTTLARTTVVASSTGSKVNFSAPPSVYVTALSVDLATSAQGMKADNAIASIVVQKFTSSGAYTPNPKLLYAIIECTGGGGGGGGGTGTASNSKNAAGGGSGSYSKTIASAAAIGASQIVTIGAGGSGGTATSDAPGQAGGGTSVGTLCIANGGGGGGGIGTSFLAFPGGTAGAAGTGDIAIPGTAGGVGGGASNSASNYFTSSGAGANSIWGSGGRSVVGVSGAVNGNAGTGYGSGGSGCSIHNSTAAATGGAGSPGMVVITEFLRA